MSTLVLTRKELYTTVFAQCFSPCGNYLVTGNNYGKIAVFNLTQSLLIDASLTSKLPASTFQAHMGYIYCFTSTERFLISGGSSHVHAWLWKDILHTKNPKPAFSIKQQSSSPFDVPETNGLKVNECDNSLILGCGDNNVYVYDMETRCLKQTFSGHSDYIHCVGLLERNQQIVSAGEDGFVKFWDVRTGEEVEQILPNKLETASRGLVGNWVSCLDVDPTEQWLVCGGAAHASVWHLRSKISTAVLPTPSSCSQVARFVEDYILTAGSEPVVFKWSVNGEMRSNFPCSPNSVYSFEVNDKLNRVLAIAGDSCEIDISTNFEYKAFSLTFKG